MDIQYADLESHHIEGYAQAAIEAGESGWFSVPLISPVEGNLWQGGCKDDVRLPDDFKFVVSLYPWERYRLGPDTQRIEHRLYDSAEIPDSRILWSVAAQVNEFCEQGQTLVHCQAGLNRSGLIAGLALIQRGYSGPDAIALLRKQRSPAVLCNKSFEKYLLTAGS